MLHPYRNIEKTTTSKTTSVIPIRTGKHDPEHPMVLLPDPVGADTFSKSLLHQVHQKQDSSKIHPLDGKSLPPSHAFADSETEYESPFGKYISEKASKNIRLFR